MAVLSTIPGQGPVVPNLNLSWGALGTGTAKSGINGSQRAASATMPRQQTSFNQYGAGGNGYSPIMGAMNFGSYAGGGQGMGTAVQGIPIWGQNGQQQGGGGYAWNPTIAGQGGPSGIGNGMPGGMPQGGFGGQQLNPAQQFLQDVQNQANTAKQANETRYDAILNRDTAGMQNAFMTWLTSKYPNATTEQLNGLVASPQIQAMYNQQNPGAAASFGGYRDRYTRNMGYLEGAGQQAETDIRNDYNKSNNKSQMDLMKRGLGSSTIMANQNASTERRKQDAVGRLKESLRRERIDADSRLSGDTLQFMERRNDTYPDQMQIADLMMKFGNAGMMGGGGYGGGGMPALQYQGQQTTSSYGVNNSRGFNQPSAYGTTKWY